MYNRTYISIKNSKDYQNSFASVKIIYHIINGKNWLKLFKNLQISILFTGYTNVCNWCFWEIIKVKKWKTSNSRKYYFFAVSRTFELKLLMSDKWQKSNYDFLCGNKKSQLSSKIYFADKKISFDHFFYVCGSSYVRNYEIVKQNRRTNNNRPWFLIPSLSN